VRTIETFLAAVALLGAWGGTAVAARQLYVDGACAVGGDGTALAPCASTAGGPGPFARIGHGVRALEPGDTLDVRGRHDGFDGVYRGEYLGLFGEDHLDCRAARCTIRGHGAERPVLSGFSVPRDWRRAVPGSDVWVREMERHDECQGLGPSGAHPARHDPDADWDPQVIVQQRRGGRVPLQYVDRVGGAAEVAGRLTRDGTWWHDLAGHRSYVNPHGTGDPNADPDTVLLVPQEQALVVIDASGTCGSGPPRVSHNLLVRQFDLEGPRSKFVEVNGRMDDPASDIRFEDVTMRFTGGRFALHTQWVARFAVERSVSEWIGRGLSWANHAHAFRTFHMDHATLADVTCRHLGTDNKGERAFLDAPWSHDTSSWWWGGTCIQVKQSNDVVVRNVVAEDLSLVGIALDVSRRTLVDGFDIRRAASGIDLQEFTPAPQAGCDERNEAHFCHNYGHVIRNGRIHATGIAAAGAIAVSPNQRDRRKKLQPGQFTAKIYNVAITHPGGAAIRVRDVDAVSVWNVSAFGDLLSILPPRGRPMPRAKGIVLMGDVQRFESRNNVFAGLGDVAIEVASPGPVAPGVSFDHDLFDVGQAGVARWKGPRSARLEGPGGLRTLGHEAHGREGPARFRRVPGSLAEPPDLHVPASSAAAGMGADLSRHFTTDAEGRPRRSWDAGAYAAGR
jgi:hypothetical protein